MRDKSMRSGTELVREIKLADCSGVQIPRDICTRLKAQLHGAILRAILHRVSGPLSVICTLPSAVG